MKKFYLLLLMALTAGSLQAQIMSENFDGFSVGDYLGVVSPTYWTTWSNAAGTSEDVQITSANANSGANSIYFSSSSSQGGPQDVVLDFNQVYTAGIFSFEADFYIESGKNAYFNFQGSSVIGNTYTLNCNMNAGSVSMDGLATGTYPAATWFTLRVEANLTLGLWEFWVDGVSAGTWSNPINSMASVDLYPIQNSAYYVDNVSFDHQTYTLQPLNAGLGGLDMVGAVSGMTVNPKVTITNAGINAITSFDVSFDYNGNQTTENITAVNLASLASMEVDITTPYTLVAGANDVTVVVSNVNTMGQDDDNSDDTLVLTFSPIVPAAGKIVLGEEATGTWCQWCPRGAVAMDRWAVKYKGYFAGVAVHNGDPMTDPIYDPGVSAQVPGYPSSLVDRMSAVDPSDMSPGIDSRLMIAPSAFIVNGATWDAVSRELNVSLTSTFQQAVTGDYRIACILSEDSVTGTTAAYNQANAYSGGSNGPMGGYENLPSSVPASMMVYDHVGRAIAPAFGGMPNSYPASVSNGAIFTHNFSFTLPADWDESKMHIIGALIAPNAQVDNVGYTTIDEAVANGFVVGIDNDDALILDGPDQTLKVYPNPATEMAYVTLKLTGTSEVDMTVYDITGKAVLARDYGVLDGSQTFPMNLDQLTAGIYSVTVRVNGKAISQKLIVE